MHTPKMKSQPDIRLVRAPLDADASPRVAGGESLLIRLSDVLVILLFSLFMCLYNTGSGSFGEGDQTTHTLVVQEMVKSGNYLHPQYDGRPYFNKPPFKMWLATIPVHFLGESNFSYRVIDGLSGVWLAVTVFLFSRMLFSSRLIAYLSVVSLMGCRILFFGHGVRNAVQDSMMLLLMTLGTVVGWRFLELLRRHSPTASRGLWALAALGGTLIGLSALTKNVAGYFSLIILGLYLILSGELFAVCRRAWKPLLLVGALSLGIPAAYILAQGENARTAFEMLLITEVFKRATKGYHFVNHPWFYWNALWKHRVVVPPELLAVGTVFSLERILRGRDKRFLFVLIWALAPVLIQNAMRSKLMWYILPAVPGMSILVGATVGSAMLAFRPQLAEWLGTGVRPRSRRLLLPAFSLLGCALLGYNAFVIGSIVAAPARRNVTDEILEDVRGFSAASGETVRAAIFDPPRMTKHEIFYWNTIPSEIVPEQNLSALRAQIERGEITLVVTGLERFETFASIRPISSYALLPGRNRRKNWLAVINYSPALLPRHFRPTRMRVELERVGEMLSFGFGFRSHVQTVGFVPTNSDVAGFRIRADGPLSKSAADLRLSLASTLPGARGTLAADVFVNEQPVGKIEAIREGFHDYVLHLPQGTLRRGENLITFRFSGPSAESTPVFFDWYELALEGAPATLLQATVPDDLPSDSESEEASEADADLQHSAE